MRDLYNTEETIIITENCENLILYYNLINFFIFRNYFYNFFYFFYIFIQYFTAILYRYIRYILQLIFYHVKFCKKLLKITKKHSYYQFVFSLKSLIFNRL